MPFTLIRKVLKVISTEVNSTLSRNDLTTLGTYWLFDGIAMPRIAATTDDKGREYALLGKV